MISIMCKQFMITFFYRREFKYLIKMIFIVNILEFSIFFLNFGLNKKLTKMKKNTFIATRYSLLATRYSLLATRYSLLATRYSLLATRYSL
jgi:hypothetical protein